ncbi:MAG: hypothetical protein AB1633_00235 [Elusimicrobiota bacterium]
MEIKRYETEVFAKVIDTNGNIYKIGLGAKALNLTDDECIKLAEQKYAEIKYKEANPDPPSYKELREKAYDEKGATRDRMIIALWKKVIEGRSEEADKLQAARLEVKQKYPKG